MKPYSVHMPNLPGQPRLRSAAIDAEGAGLLAATTSRSGNYGGRTASDRALTLSGSSKLAATMKDRKRQAQRRLAKSSFTVRKGSLVKDISCEGWARGFLFQLNDETMDMAAPVCGWWAPSGASESALGGGEGLLLSRFCANYSRNTGL
eukprot:SAG31_NODE_10991_length_1075_cov_1.263320_2_plen_149_part_00